MTDLPVGRYPRLAGPSDIPRLISGENVIHVWPPPGTTVVPIGTPATWYIVYGTPTAGDADTWFVTTLSELHNVFGSELLLEFLLRFSQQFQTSPISVFVSSVGQWPVILEANGGQTLRWIRATFRGVLGGGVEQFQHKFDLGVPGNDPTLAEADAQDLADVLKGWWKTAFVALHSTNGNTSLADAMAGHVRYTEVGVAQFHQDDEGTSANPAGDREQDYPAAWSAYTLADAMTGTTTSTLPFEVACAVTLQTDTRGPRGRGRIYLPPFRGDASVGTNGLYNTQFTKAAGLAVGQFFDTILGDGVYQPIVVSSRAKQLHAITSVSVGSVPDSQRRRRRSQVEAPVQYWTPA